MRYKVYIEENKAFQEIVGSLVLPLNIQDLLDESLDLAQFVCYNSSEERYKVGKSVKIELYEGNTRATTLYCTVANDDAKEYPNGSGEYKHTVSVVEPTKDLEGVFCQTNTYTNARPQSTVQQYARTYHFYETAPAILIPELDGLVLKLDAFKTPQFGNTYQLPTVQEIGAAFKTAYEKKYPSRQIGTLGQGSQYQYDTVSLEVDSPKVLYGDTPGTVTNETGVIHFAVTVAFSNLTDGLLFDVSLSLLPPKERKETKKWTVASVVQRLFDIAEPEYAVSTPAGMIILNPTRFHLDATDEAELGKVLSPEFVLSNSNLRECLKTIGGKIHAEPRVKEVYFSGGRKNYTVGFDYRSKQESAGFIAPYLIRQSQQDISNYCTRLYSTAKNVVSSLNFNATRKEPSADGFIATRAEQTNERVTSTNAIIKTQEPIYELISVKCKIIDNDGDQLYPETDITESCYEATVYDSLLASKNIYPDSKSYAIRWERGSKNITGLFYQAPNSVTAAFSKYSIVNIIAQRSTDPQQTARTLDAIATNPETLFCFQVVYKPVTNTAFIHEKNEYSEDDPFTTPYNQSDSLVELDYYGEHIRGAVERLGNPEKIITAIYSTFSSIPETGKIVEQADGEYYIAARTISVESNHYKVSFALSKNFNRLSQYVGIDSRKRIEEIPINQSYERDVILPVKLVIGALPQTPKSPYIYVPIENFRALFDEDEETETVTQALLSSEGVSVCLPAMATGYGTTTVLTVSLKDNYSAGEKLRYVDQNEIKGYWQQDVRFGDYFGRAAYFDLYFAHSIDASNGFAITSPETSASAPTDGVKLNSVKYLLRKDARERLSTVGISICAQTSIEGLTLGSGISKMNGLVETTENKAKIYFVPNDEELPYKLDDSIVDYNYEEWESADITVSSVQNNTFYLEEVDAPIAGKGFVIAFPVYEETVSVTDDFGNIVTQTLIKGGEIVAVSNKPFPLLETLLGEEYTFRME